MDLEEFKVYYEDDPRHAVILNTDEDLESALEQLESTTDRRQPQRPKTYSNGSVPHLTMRLFVSPLDPLA